MLDVYFDAFQGILQKVILRMLTLHQVILHKDIHKVTLLKGILHKGILRVAMDHHLLSMLSSSNSRTLDPHLWKDVWLLSAAVACLMHAFEPDYTKK